MAKNNRPQLRANVTQNNLYMRERLNLYRGCNGIINEHASVDVFFEDIESAIVHEIEQWPVVVGCMAWMTNEAILRALASRQVVSIIVQKEDFLRPDSDSSWSERNLRKLYESLPEYWALGTPYDTNASLHREAVRCMGICADRKTTPPRMHHKFLVFCERTEECYVPKAVWTGSFNATKNATRSIENGVIIRSDAVASCFYDEWEHVLGSSEKLDWKSPYVCPEYRIGT